MEDEIKKLNKRIDNMKENYSKDNVINLFLISGLLSVISIYSIKINLYIYLSLLITIITGIYTMIKLMNR